jgi:hypothetical protein
MNMADASWMWLAGFVALAGVSWMILHLLSPEERERRRRRRNYGRVVPRARRPVVLLSARTSRS